MSSALQLKNIRNISGKNIRTFAAAVQAKTASKSGEKEAPFLPREDVKTTTSAGLVVSTVETNKPVSKIAVYFKAGSRFQDESNQGVVHALKIASGLGTKNSTKFGIARNIEHRGGNLSCTIGREHVAYTLEAARDQIEQLEPYFKDAVARQEFKQWELQDSVSRLKIDVQSIPSEVRVLEMIHWAAFRRSLGNSLFTPKYMIGKHTQDMLADFVKKNFVEASVVGVGVSHDYATRLTEGLGIHKGDNSALPSKFVGGGEVRKTSSDDLAYVALALEGVGLSDRKGALAAAVLQRALGSGPRTKRGNNPGGKLHVAHSDQSTSAGFSASYSDSGIIGAYIVGTSAAIENTTKKSAEVLRTASFSEEEVTRAKNILKADIASNLDAESGLLDDIGLQSLFNGGVSSYNDVVKTIDSITASDVNNVIKKGKGKLAMAAFGKIGRVPYLDEL